MVAPGTASNLRHQPPPATHTPTQSRRPFPPGWPAWVGCSSLASKWT